MKTCVSKTFSFVFPKKPAISQNNVIYLISRAFPVEAMPLFWRLLAFPRMIKRNINDAYNAMRSTEKFSSVTYCPRLVWRRRVTRVEAPGHVQLLAKSAYLNSSSHTTNSANFTCNLFSGLNIWTYCGTSGAKSLTAQDLKGKNKTWISS